MLESLDLFGWSVSWYLIFGVLATAAGTSFFTVYGQRYRLFQRPAHAVLFCLCAALLGVMVARVWSVASFAWFSGRFGSMGAFFETLTPWETLGRGGLVWYGGFVPVFLWVLVLRRWMPRDQYRNFLDVAALMGCLAQSVARIGCFLSGCCFGTWSTVPWAVYVRQGSSFNLVPRHPTNLYLCASHLLLFALLLTRDRGKPVAGIVFMEFLLGHAAIRFVNAYFRTPPEVALGLTAQQWISLGLLAFGGLGRWYLLRKREEQPSSPLQGLSLGLSLGPSFVPASRIAVSALAVLVLFLGTFAVVDTLAMTPRSRPLAERVALSGLDGESASLTAFEGRPVVVNLWASWCAPCRAEMPELNRFARRRQDVAVIGVNVGEGVERVRLAKDLLKIDFPILRAEAGAAQELGGGSLPRTLILDADGSLVAVHQGAVTEEDLEALLRGL